MCGAIRLSLDSHGLYKTKDGYFPTVHSKSKERLKNMLREILSRNRKQSISAVKETLHKKLRGWCEYFKFAKYETWSNTTVEWIRRRIRQLLWKTWKRGKKRYAALRKLGCPHGQAIQWANTRKSYWRIAHSHIHIHILSTTLSNDFLKSQGWSWLGLTRVDGYGCQNYGKRRKTPREGRLPDRYEWWCERSVGEIITYHLRDPQIPNYYKKVIFMLISSSIQLLLYS